MIIKTLLIQYANSGLIKIFPNLTGSNENHRATYKNINSSDNNNYQHKVNDISSASKVLIGEEWKNYKFKKYNVKNSNFINYKKY